VNDGLGSSVGSPRQRAGGWRVDATTSWIDGGGHDRSDGSGDDTRRWLGF
jgi:hypothetical protein